MLRSDRSAVSRLVPVAPDSQSVAEDYTALGLSLKRDLIAFLRQDLQRKGVVTAEMLRTLPNDRRVAVAVFVQPLLGLTLKNEPAGMSELGESLGMSPGNMMVLVGGLEKEGWFAASATSKTAGSCWSSSPRPASRLRAGEWTIAFGSGRPVRRPHMRRTSRVAQAIGESGRFPA